MSDHALVIPPAGSFTFGCAAIHVWRGHAEALTPVLTAAAFCLTVLTGAVVLMKGGETDRAGSSVPATP